MEVLWEQADYDALYTGLVTHRYNVVFAPTYMRNMFDNDDTIVIPAMKYRPYIVISRYHYLYNSDSASYKDFLGDTAVMLKGKNYELYDRMAEYVLKEIGFNGKRIHNARNTLEMATQLLGDHRFLIGNLLFSPVGKGQYRTVPLPESIKDNWGVDLIYLKDTENDMITSFISCFRSGKKKG